MFFMKLFSIREENDLTQKEIADILKVSQASYSRWENGIEIIPLIKLIKFCNYFNVSLDYICNLKSKNKGIVDKPVVKEKIGNNLLKFRKEKSLTQKKLAIFLNTTPSTICAYEKGKTLILTSFAYQICKEYNVSMDWLCDRN